MYVCVYCLCTPTRVPSHFSLEREFSINLVPHGDNLRLVLGLGRAGNTAFLAVVPLDEIEAMLHHRIRFPRTKGMSSHDSALSVHTDWDAEDPRLHVIFY